MDKPEGYSKFDAHFHAIGPKAYLRPLFNALNITGALNLSYSNLRDPAGLAAFEETLRQDMDQFAGCLQYAPTFSITGFNERGYADAAIKKLTNDIEHRGAVAVKIWKDLGMMLRDIDGKYVFCDDVRFKPIFDFIASKRLPIVCHQADPMAGWQSLDIPSPHTAYFRAHPEFHWYNKPDKPGHDEILSHRDALIARYPDTIFIAAHLASLEHDLSLLGHFLDTYPNTRVDTAARFGDLRLKPKQEAREFFIRYQDRVLYGTDWDYEDSKLTQDPAGIDYASHARVQNFRKIFAFFEEELELPGPVLRKFYYDNAAALLIPREATPAK